MTICVFTSAFAVGNEQDGFKKSNTCSACHGKRGISINPLWPNLAGQNEHYLLKQLIDFKKGNHPIMSPAVQHLNEQDMAMLAAFYANLPPPSGTTLKTFLKRGEQLYRGGDYKKHITACIACHGPRGTGNNQAGFPSLSGQNPAYTIQQLQAFKAHTRQNDLHSIMQDISSRMSVEDMEAVAHYVAGLH